MTEAPRLSLSTAGRTTVLQLLARVVATGCALGTLAIVARHLGTTGYADWGTTLSLVAMAGTVLIDPGLSTVVVRRLADGTAPVPTPAALLRLRLGLALVAWAVVAGVTVTLRGPDALWPAVVLGGQLLPRALLVNVGTWLQAEHRLHVGSAADVAAAVLGLGGAVVAAALDGSPAVLAACAVLGPVLVVSLVLQREARGRGGSTERSVLADVVREALPLGIAVVLVAVYTRVGFVFVNVVEADRVVAEFALAFQFVEQLVLVAGIVAGTVLPLLARRGRDRDLVADPVTARLVAAVAGGGAAAAVALIVLAGPLVTLLGGSEFADAERLLVLLAPVAVGLLLNFFCGYLLIALRLGRRYLMYNAVGLALNLGAHAVFTLSEGASAAARVTWATEYVVAGLAAAPLLRGRPKAAAAVIVSAVVAVAASELVAR